MGLAYHKGFYVSLLKTFCGVMKIFSLTSNSEDSGKVCLEYGVQLVRSDDEKGTSSGDEDTEASEVSEVSVDKADLPNYFVTCLSHCVPFSEVIVGDRYKGIFELGEYQEHIFMIILKFNGMK